MSMNNIDLLPCPFCGDPNPAMQGRTDNALNDFHSAWVECETCGVTSKGFYRMSDAAEAWNQRHEVSELKDELDAADETIKSLRAELRCMEFTKNH